MYEEAKVMKGHRASAIGADVRESTSPNFQADLCLALKFT